MLDDDAGLTGQFAGYSKLLTNLKARIRLAQVRAALSVNREWVPLYWQIGRAILSLFNFFGSFEKHDANPTNTGMIR